MGAVFWAASGQSSHLCTYLVWLGVLPGVHTHLSAKMNFGTQFSGRLAGHIMGSRKPVEAAQPGAYLLPHVHLLPHFILLAQRLGWEINRRVR